MSQPGAPQPVDVALRDGSTVRVRPVRPGDVDGLGALLGGMSEESRWLRFLTAAANLESAARFAADPGDGAGLVVTAGSPERIVAHALYALETPDRAELAFEVADEWHGRGIATILLAHLASLAERQGVATFVAYVHASNHRMIGVFRESGFAVEVRATAGELEVELPAALGAAARDRFEDRSRAAAVAAVAHVLRPASLAVVGASRRRPSVGAAVLDNILGFGYRGALHVVHPEAEAVAGVPAHRSIGSVPGPVELAVLAVPAARVLGVARECGAAGVRALAVLSAGFMDAGPEGRARLAELLEVCRAAGMRLVGPNCLGVLNSDASVRVNATFARLVPPPGRVALASQSGAIGIAVMAEAARRGLGLSSFVSTGDKADLSGNDFLQYWEQDPGTDVVLLYLESFGNPRRFGRIARRVAAAKPIVAVKSGRAAAGTRAGATRTGALLSASDISVDALFTHAGIIRTDTVSEQIDTAALLASQPLPDGPSVAIVTNARGPALACADACTAAGLQVVRDPLDLNASATPADYGHALGGLAGDPGVDAVVTIFTPPLDTRAEDVARALRSAAGALGKPLLAVFVATGDAELAALAGDMEIPVYRGPEEAARALGHVARYAAWCRQPADPPPALDGVDPDAAAAVIARALTRGEGWLEPAEASELLGAYRVPLADARGAGVQLVAGVLADADFGPVVACALGGPTAELLGDATIRLAPLGRREATEMVRSLRSFPLLDGYRGAPRADVPALQDLLLRISALAAAHAEVAELDCDPVLAGPDGATVVSARVRVQPAASSRPFPALDR
jgi:acyl-CoA synthetase (NDP forming)/GNAT superfamily N-acetyltransferase